PMTINSTPPGLSFTASGNGCLAGTFPTPTAVKTVNLPNLSCTITFTSPQPAPGTQYLFTGWTDGITANPRTYATPSAPVTYTANFKTQYFLTTSAGPGGAISPASGFFDSGSVLVTATPNSGYVFAGFTGDLTGAT